MQYERRLPEYRSGAPAQFAVEVAGGRLAQLGVAGRQPPGLRYGRAGRAGRAERNFYKQG